MDSVEMKKSIDEMAEGIMRDTKAEQSPLKSMLKEFKYKHPGD